MSLPDNQDTSPSSAMRAYSAGWSWPGARIRVRAAMRFPATYLHECVNSMWHVCVHVLACARVCVHTCEGTCLHVHACTLACPCVRMCVRTSRRRCSSWQAGARCPWSLYLAAKQSKCPTAVRMRWAPLQKCGWGPYQLQRPPQHSRQCVLLLRWAMHSFLEVGYGVVQKWTQTHAPGLCATESGPVWRWARKMVASPPCFPCPATRAPDPLPC